MASISPGAPVVTVISVFTVAPGRQRELVELLEQATAQVLARQPGFVSASLHVGLEGDRVVGYEQWGSEGDYARVLADPVCRERRAAAGGLATVSTERYRVASVRMRPGL